MKTRLLMLTIAAACAFAGNASALTKDVAKNNFPSRDQNPAFRSG